jgi:hypothetical protein
MKKKKIICYGQSVFFLLTRPDDGSGKSIMTKIVSLQKSERGGSEAPSPFRAPIHHNRRRRLCTNNAARVRSFCILYYV